MQLLLSTVDPCQHVAVMELVQQHGIGRAVLIVMAEYWNEMDREAAKNDFNAKKIDSPFYRLLHEEFGIKVHFQQADSHRAFLRKAFDRLRSFVPSVTEEQILVHDLSKYSFEQAVGYTAKWVHDVEWNNSAWQTALRHHYATEPHHPEHYTTTCEMPDSYLQESILDMVASRWERQLGGSDDVTNYELVNFDPKFLSRYSEGDFVRVEAIIKRIQQCD
ncbi:uncharacterized protein LOC135474691 [Liolophura sinensis]|uniref:uncharacterized protein LOC135474691 n=1 Tax=Liolophura sinensis TaxID=3198878 RepID=UPI0031595EC5